MKTTKRHRQPLEVMAQMNITNLLDTAFILLITFMLVAPQLTHGIKLDLPEVENAPSLDREPDKTLLITIQKQDADEPVERIYIDEERVTLEQVRERVTDAFASRPELSVVVEADQDSKSGVFIQVIAEVRQVGVENVGISVLPGEESR